MSGSGSGVGAPRVSYRGRCLHSQSSPSKGDTRRYCNPRTGQGRSHRHLRWGIQYSVVTASWGWMLHCSCSPRGTPFVTVLKLKKDQPLLCPSLAQLQTRNHCLQSQRHGWVSWATLTWSLSPSQPAGGIYSWITPAWYLLGLELVPLQALVPKCSQEWPQFPLWFS